jgi:hypothetical protein
MASTKNECEIVNRLSRKVEKELSENMDKVNEDISEINEKIADMAIIDDSVEASDSTWSSAKIKTEIDAGGGSDVINDNIVSTTSTFSSDLITNFIVNNDKFIKSITGSFSRIESNFSNIKTIDLTDVLKERGFEMKYTQQDGFTTDRSGIVTIQLVGNTTGTVYIEKNYTGYDLIPEGSTHMNISDDFMFDAGDIDSSDIALIYKIKAINGPWSTSFPYTFKLMAIPFNAYL